MRPQRIVLHFTLAGMVMNLAACTVKPGPDTSYLNRVMKPLGWGRRLDPQRAAESATQVNSIYYFLLGKELAANGHTGEAVIALDRVRKLDPEAAFVHYALAQEYLKKGLSQEGVAMVRKAVELDPKNREARLLLANLFATAKKHLEATQLFEELLSEEPDNEEVVLNLALLDLDQKKYDLAQKRLAAYLERNPDSAIASFYIGRIEQERGRKPEALRAYQKAIELREGFVQAGTYLAFLQEEMGDRKGALATFAWLASDTDGARYHKKLGQLHLEQGDYPRALEAFLNVERLDAQDLNNKAKIGLLYLETKQPALAEKKFQEVLKDAPDSDNVRFYLAAVYEELKRPNEALAEYARVPATSKLYVDSVRKRALILQRSGRAGEGWKVLKDALASVESETAPPVEATSSSPEATSAESAASPEPAAGGDEAASEEARPSRRVELTEVAVGYLELQGRFDEAADWLEKALRRESDSERLLYAKGVLLEKQGLIEDAVSSMQRILNKDPEHAAALNFVGFVWAEHGLRLNEAESYIRRALKIRPQDPFITDSLGWVLYKRGRYKAALATLEGALKLAPDESVIADHLGDVLVKLGRLHDARLHYEKALQLGPERESDRKSLETKLAKLPKGAQTVDCPECAGRLREPRSPAQTAAP